MPQIFQGVWIPIITPFNGDQVDHSALEKLAQSLAVTGISGFIAGATTGEGALLTSEELAQVFATLRSAAPTLPIVMGLSEAATQKAVAVSKNLAQLRPDGILATPPTYVRPTQRGIQLHFEAIVEATDLPLLIYNIPYRTGIDIEIQTLQRLARDPRVVGMKECGGSSDRMMRLVNETPLRILSGDDNQNFMALCLGVHGTIAASAHVFPELHVRIYNLLQEGRVLEARPIALALQQIIHDLFAEPNPAPLKGLLALQGICFGTLRLPFVPASPDLCARLMEQCRVLARDQSVKT